MLQELLPEEEILDLFKLSVVLTYFILGLVDLSLFLFELFEFNFFGVNARST